MTRHTAVLLGGCALLYLVVALAAHRTAPVEVRPLTIEDAMPAR